MPNLRCVNTIKPNPHNARTHPKTQICALAKSISTFGFVAPILVDESGVIVIGHGRYEAAKLLGLKRIPVNIVKGLSDAKRRALAIADNKLAEDAGWDRERLALELPEISELLVEEGLDISITGFDLLDVGQLTVEFKGPRHDNSGGQPHRASRIRNRDRAAVCRYCGQNIADIDVTRRRSRRGRSDLA